MAALERWLHYTSDHIDRFHCIYNIYIHGIYMYVPSNNCVES